MPLSILLFFVIAVSGFSFEVDVDALFLGPNFAQLNHAGRASNVSSALRKRYDQARFTFFDTGLGACGTTNSPSDFIVALNTPQYGNGEHCYEMIEITYKGKTAQAQIVDECPGCPWAALDFSTGLFDYFASEDKGVIYGSWVFAGGASSTSGTSGALTSSIATSTTTTAISTTAITTTTSTSGAPSSSTTEAAGGLEGLNVVLGSLVGLIVVAAEGDYV